MVLIPNCTFSLCFGSISGELSPAMAHILVRNSQVKISMVRPDEPDIYASEVYQEVGMGIYCTHIQSSNHDFVVISSQ